MVIPEQLLKVTVLFIPEAGIDGGLKVIDITRSKKTNVGRYYIVLEIECRAVFFTRLPIKEVSVVTQLSDSPVILRVWGSP